MERRQAEDALDTIAQVRQRAGELRVYRATGSIVIAWGIVWLCGFGALQIFPSLAWAVWTAGWIGALGWTFTRPSGPEEGRAQATWVLAVFFVGLLLAALRADMPTAAMVAGLALGAAYAALGIWGGKRFLALAAVVTLATIVGWWIIPGWLYGLLAIGGGGALVAGGAWLLRP